MADRKFTVWLAVMFAFGALTARAQPHCEVFGIHSRALKDNPLGDPSIRYEAVIYPSQVTNGHPMPIVYYLPGFGYSYSSFGKNSNNWLHFTQKVADEITPMIFVIVDGRNRWGGSQYVNSSAQGNYADYVCEEVANAVERRNPVPVHGVRRIVAGHSSGGFGALRLGMSHHNLFDAVIALSPDGDFPDSHLPLVKISAVARATPLEVSRIVAEPPSRHLDGDLAYALALSAAYAPGRHGHFEWLYDDDGNFRKDVWQLWLNNDPLTIVEKDRSAFGSNQAVYLEGAAQDEYSANISAAKIYDELQKRPVRSTFVETPGHHSDHVFDRLERGLGWVVQGNPVTVK